MVDKTLKYVQDGLLLGTVQFMQFADINQYLVLATTVIVLVTAVCRLVSEFFKIIKKDKP
jgi:hypothetical protein